MSFLLRLFARSKIGAALIEHTIAQFEQGVQQDIEKAAKNDDVIVAMAAQNRELNAAMERGRVVVAKTAAVQ